MTRTTSVIIPVWNGREVLPACLEALAGQAPGPDEVILIDDGSTDHGLIWVEEHFPQITTRRHDVTRGFVHSVNEGLSIASGELILLLNQDTVVQAGWLQGLLEAAAQPGVSIVGSRVLNPDGSPQQCGGMVDVRGDTSHDAHPTLTTDDAPTETQWVTGASLAITRDALQQVGPLDEAFAPAYYEDVEWCLRARASGLRVLYAPASELIHLAESHLSRQSDSFMRLYHRNRLRLVLKHWTLDDLEENFAPAERVWLERLAVGGERLVVVMQRLYLDNLMALDRLCEQRILQEDAREVKRVIASVLAGLREVIPLGPAGLGMATLPPPARPEQAIPIVPAPPTLPPLPDAVQKSATRQQPALPPPFVHAPPPGPPLPPPLDPLPPAPEEVPPPDSYIPPTPDDSWRGQIRNTLQARIEETITPYLDAERRRLDHIVEQQRQQLAHSNAVLRQEMQNALATLRHELRHADAQERHKTLEMLAIYHQQIEQRITSQGTELARGLVHLHQAVEQTLSTHHQAMLELSVRLQDTAHQSLQQAIDAERHQRGQLAEVLRTYLSEQAHTITQLAQQVAELQARAADDQDPSPPPAAPSSD